MNLNNLKIDNDTQSDFSVVVDDKQIEVYFKDIENSIIKKIRKYDNVVGCIAWLTNNNILKELAKKKAVIIIIQEEDFLRPDSQFDGQKEKWKNTIYKLYNKIEKLGNIYLGHCGINTSDGTGIKSGIRRVGLINKDKLPAFPRMHNKFIICFNDNINHEDETTYTAWPGSKHFFFGDEYEYSECSKCDGYEYGEMYGEVLTGSYNYTENSNNSFENVICIKEQLIVTQYFRQFAELCIMAIQLDWETEWTPNGSEDMRYGT